MTESGRAKSGRNKCNAGFVDDAVLLAKWSDDHVAVGKEVLSVQKYKSTGWSFGLKHSPREFRLNFSLVHIAAYSIGEEQKRELERLMLSFLLNSVV